MSVQSEVTREALALVERCVGALTDAENRDGQLSALVAASQRLIGAQECLISALRASRDRFRDAEAERECELCDYEFGCCAMRCACRLNSKFSDPILCTPCAARREKQEEEKNG